MQSVDVLGTAVYPSKIVCIGRNYVAHIRELANEIPDSMVVFNKPNSSISTILRSHMGGETLHYEGELAFSIRDSRLSAVGFGLDLTRRTLQSELKHKGLPWERAKAFDGAALFGAFVALPDDIERLTLRLAVDGELRQTGGVEMMLYRPEAILRELSTFTTMEDGDIIMTGTPAGVGEVRPGQVFEGQVFHGEKCLASASWIAQ